MYNLSLTEEEISIILQSVNFFEEHSMPLREEYYNIISDIRTKIDEIL